MIAYLEGKVLIQEKDRILLKAGHVGYEIFVANNDLNFVINEDLSLYIYTKISEDNISLYGFRNLKEKQFFEMLLTVKGIGAKNALNIISQIDEKDFAVAIVNKDISQLTKLKSVGLKMAKQIIFDINKKLEKFDLEEILSYGNLKNRESNIKQSLKMQEFIQAMSVLGYTKSKIDEFLKLFEEEKSLEENIKNCLKNSL